jgi:hypothetical protein
MKFEIKNRFSGLMIYQGEAENLKDLLAVAVKSGANLRDANLWGTNLRGANLRDANLRGANFRGANLQGADLWGTNLQGADLRDANLRDANLWGTNLWGTKNIPNKVKAETSIVPETGGFQGWKKCQNGVIVRLRIPAAAKRSNATGRKCRAERALVLEVIGDEVGVSQYEYAPKIVYKKGEVVTCNVWDPNRWVECGGGIHFFLTRYEAENYS